MRCNNCRNEMVYRAGHYECVIFTCYLYGRPQDDCCSGETA